MKKVMVVLLTVCILFSEAGCSFLNDTYSLTKQTETVFSIDSYNLQITADNAFHQEPISNFDLQLTNRNSYISIMAYKYIDLANNSTPLDIYDMQNEDLFSRRENVTIIEDVEVQSLPQAVVTQTTYSAEREGIKNYYVSYLIDFPNAETFAWVLVTAVPSYIDNNRAYLNNIVCSLESIE